MLLKEIVLNGEIHLYDTQAYNNDKETFLIQSNLKKNSLLQLFCPDLHTLYDAYCLTLRKIITFFSFQTSGILDNLKGQFKGTMTFFSKILLTTYSL